MIDIHPQEDGSFVIDAGTHVRDDKQSATNGSLMMMVHAQ